MKFTDEDSQFFYVALFSVNANVCKKWTPFKDKQGGEFVAVTEFSNPILLKLQKIEITYKGRDGNPDKIQSPTEWDEFFINEWKELATQYPDGKVAGIFDCSESSFGAINRYKVETNEAKKVLLKELFLDVKPTEEEIAGFDEINPDDIHKKGSGVKNYIPQETTSQVLEAKLAFVTKHLAALVEPSDDELMPLYVYIAAIANMQDEKKKQQCISYLNLLLRIVSWEN